MKHVVASLRIIILIQLILAGRLLAQSTAQGKSALWEVRGVSNVVYLQGSVHLLKPENYPLKPAIETAFSNSAVLVLEVNLGDAASMSQQESMAKGILPAGQTLEKVLSPSSYALARTRAREIGLDLARFSSCKPWVVAMAVAVAKCQALGFNPQDGLDYYFFRKAKASGKKITGLETAEFQIKLFDSMPLSDQGALLAQTLRELDVMEKDMDQILEAWSSGRADDLEKVLLESFKEFPSLYRKLLTDRNTTWMTSIEAALRSGRNHMVVVGAGHLVGADGLVQRLRKKGYTVKQM